MKLSNYNKEALASLKDGGFKKEEKSDTSFTYEAVGRLYSQLLKTKWYKFNKRRLIKWQIGFTLSIIKTHEK